MKLHKLTMCGVGPFGGTEEIDFSELGSNGLFLLEGPTGIGKSTIIDAIVFALYGTVAGAEATNHRMRSKFADPASETFVELVFETQSGVHRVRRTPKYDRPKRRGDGYVSQEATVKLFRMASPDAEEGEFVTDRQDESGSEIARAIGLTKAQFTQTVVLPQGQFADFLRTTPDERRGLLQKLFGTQLYEDIAIRLMADRNTAIAQRSAARRAVEDRLTMFAVAAECAAEAVSAISAEIESPKLAEWLDQNLERVTEAWHASTRVATEARARLEVATDRRSQAIALAAKLQRRQDLVARLTALSAEGAEYARWLTLLELLTAAQAASPALENLNAARRRSIATQASYESLKTMLRDIGVTAQQLDEPREAASALRFEAGQLDELIIVESGLPQIRDRIADLVRCKTSDVADLEAISALIAELPGQIASASELLEESRAAATALPALAAELTRLEHRAAAARHVVDLHAHCSAAEAELGRAKLLANEAAVHTARLTELWTAGIAGELASTLTAAAPCPVCGSLEHPAPADFSTDQVTRLDVETATTAQTAALDAVSVAETEFNTHRRSLAAAEAVAQGVAPDEAEVQAREAQARHGAAQAAHDDRSARQAAVDQLLQEQQVTTQSAQALREKIVRSDADINTAEQSLAHDIARADAAKSGFASVADRVEMLTRQAKGLDELVGAFADLAHCARDTSERESNLADVLRDSPIADEAELLALLPQLPDIALLRERIDTHDVGLKSVTEQLETKEMQDIADQANPDVSITEAAATAAEKTYNDAQKVEAENARIVERASQRRKDLALASDAFATVLADTEEVIRVAEVANATSNINLDRISLPSYVLITRFQHVIAAANGRLMAMSDGRYQLERRAEKESNGRRSGLGLIVQDLTTGSTRAPHDLSGGESFYTALALALGLADVVTSEAGGIELGTLFIDEGFGSLDPDTLDAVLNEIGKLRSGGRTVGVVSHVDELKQRIPERVEVRKTAGGASTLAIVGTR